MSTAQSTVIVARHRTVDDSLALLRKGYRYGLDLRSRAGADAVTTRLMGRPALVVAGTEGVRLFYDDSRLMRHRALPGPLANTLFGRGAIHTLDDDDHRHRKGMFLDLLTPDAAHDIAVRADAEWQLLFAQWVDGDVPVFDAAVEVHCRAGCGWAGVPAARVEDHVARDLIAIVDGFGGIGLRHLHARRARWRADRWARALVRDVRAGTLTAPDGSALAIVAAHRALDGEVLPERTAAVELLNMVRPTVAVAYFVAFAIDALRDHDVRPALAGGDAATAEAFAHEVRRVYPFVPVLGAKARHDFTWNGVDVRKGSMVVLDVYGTLHDRRWWDHPFSFDADRFRTTPCEREDFVPQGGGDPRTGHRCPGERVAVELIATAASAFAAVDYEVPAQDLSLSLSRMPTRAPDGTTVRRSGTTDG